MIHSTTQNGRVPFIDGKDIAVVAVEALMGLALGELLLTGPEAKSYDEIAAETETVTGREVTQMRLSAAELGARYDAAGLPHVYAELLAAVDGDIAKVPKTALLVRSSASPAVNQTRSRNSSALIGHC